MFLFLISAFIQIVFWIAIFFVFILKKNKSKKNLQKKDFLPLSVVICAHNEAHNLANFLPQILLQKYPTFEVIVVDDRSDDNSSTILKNLQKNHTHLKIVVISKTPENINPKKYALSEGIKNSLYDTLILTDADCFPASENWLWEISPKIFDKHQVGLGVSLYQKEKSFLNQFIQYETLFTAIQYIGFALLGKVYMGVGRNLVYSKKLFEQKKGFDKIATITGGDDDLLIGKIANKNNTYICLSPHSFTYSVPKKTWSEWYQQKKRHLSVGVYYRLEIKILLILLQFSNIFFWWIGFFLIFSNFFLILSVFFVKITLNWFIFAVINRKYFNSTNFYLLPLFDFLFTIYFIVVGLMTFFTKKIRWKS